MDHVKAHSVESMIGDVNMFLTEEYADGIEEFDDSPSDANATNATKESEVHIVGELELMIAEPQNRRKGYGTKIVDAFLHYVESSGIAKNKQILKYRVKVGSQNKPSIRLFKKLGFSQVKYNAYFDHVELELMRTS